ncbi:MAG TPA: flagellar protein FlgN [Clostridiales bacterium]|nr:flagellar protein FlgN [Clostridiales bacterium]
MMESIEKMMNDLVELLEEKKAVLEKIHELTLKQKEDIENNQGDNINGFIDKKQVEIDKINVIDEDFANTVKKLKLELDIESLEQVDTDRFPQMKVMRVKIEEILSLGNDIMKLEEYNKDKIIEIINHIKKDLKAVNLGRKSVKAYEKPNIDVGGIYIDRKK